jgi:hypothetical protein
MVAFSWLKVDQQRTQVLTFATFCVKIFEPVEMPFIPSCPCEQSSEGFGSFNRWQVQLVGCVKNGIRRQHDYGTRHDSQPKGSGAVLGVSPGLREQLVARHRDHDARHEGQDRINVHGNR